MDTNGTRRAGFEAARGSVASPRRLRECQEQADAQLGPSVGDSGESAIPVSGEEKAED